jgi:hypothetical protein
VQTSAQVGAALVLAVTTALVTGGHQGAGATAGQMLDAYRPGLFLSVLVAAAGLTIAAWPRRRSTVPDLIVPESESPEPERPEPERAPVG